MLRKLIYLAQSGDLWFLRKTSQMHLPCLEVKWESIVALLPLPMATKTRLLQSSGMKLPMLPFVTVTKEDGIEWDHTKPALLGAIMEHFQSGQEAMSGEAAPEHSTEVSEEDAPIVSQIKELLDSRVRPAVAQDGGDITFHGFDRGVVYLQMKGACAGCPSSAVTLKNGIENMLKHYVGEVKEIRAVDEILD